MSQCGSIRIKPSKNLFENVTAFVSTQGGVYF